MTPDVSKDQAHATDLKGSHFAHTLPCDRRLSQSSLGAALSDPFALGAALALDAAFNLWICGNREDFLSTDPMAPSVHNPVPFSHTALLTRIKAIQSVWGNTHIQACPDTNTPPPSFCFTSLLYSTKKNPATTF